MDHIKPLLKKLTSKQFMTYVAIGVTAFVADYATFFILYKKLGLTIIFANTSGFILGLVTSFILNRMFTFKTEEFSKKTHHQAVIYLALALFNLIFINVFVLVLKGLGIPPEIAKLGGMGVILLWNFVIFSKLIFN